jgi:hypothetical protein
MRRTQRLLATLGFLLSVNGRLTGQDATPPAPAPGPTPAPGAESSPLQALKEPVAYRPIEGNVIINLPSVEVPSKGTLTLLVTHRFNQRVQEGDINNFFTLDSGNTWGFGLWYAPIKNLNVGFYRTSELATYEASAEYGFPRVGGFAASLRVGEDWRTEVIEAGNETFPFAASPKSSFFAQAVLAYSFGPYLRITAVPTYLQRTNRFYRDDLTYPPPGDRSCTRNPNVPTLYSCSGLYENIFNVPIAASIAITHSITVHAEVTPRLSAVNSRGVGWTMTIEKSLLRHRFAFFAGNVRTTTVDQYTGSVPFGQSPKNIYLGFNLFRAWKLN